MTIHDEQIRPAIVIEVNAAGAPSKIWDCRGADGGFIRNIREAHCIIVAVECVALVLEVSDVNGKPATMVEVTGSNSHSRYLPTITAHCCSGDIADVCEVPIAIVAIEIVRRRVVSYEQIGTPIIVEVAPKHAEAVVAAGIVNTGAL